jgi:parallel beta-helix repeat protein
MTQITIIEINADHCTLQNLTIKTTMGSVTTRGILINSSNNNIQNTNIISLSEGINLSKLAKRNNINNNYVYNNQYGIKTWGSSYNSITNNTIQFNAQYAMLLEADSDYNILAHNDVIDNDIGIRIRGSVSNRIFNNCFMNNRQYGLYFCCGAFKNIIYLNSFRNKGYRHMLEDPNLANFWYKNSTGGNYYDDYNGSDINKDGFGDTPYEISTGDQDIYPLMTPPFNVPCDQ